MMKALLLGIVVLGLTACNGTNSPTETMDIEQGTGGSYNESEQIDLSFFDDLPEWLLDSLTEEGKEQFLAALNSMTPAEIEDFIQQLEGSEPTIMDGSQLVEPGDMDSEEGGFIIFR